MIQDALLLIEKKIERIEDCCENYAENKQWLKLKQQQNSLFTVLAKNRLHDEKCKREQNNEKIKELENYLGGR